jgi:hypothetical protein
MTACAAITTAAGVTDPKFRLYIDCTTEAAATDIMPSRVQLVLAHLHCVQLAKVCLHWHLDCCWLHATNTGISIEDSSGTSLVSDKAAIVLKEVRLTDRQKPAYTTNAQPQAQAALQP